MSRGGALVRHVTRAAVMRMGAAKSSNQLETLAQAMFTVKKALDTGCYVGARA
jgi:hypothetical protein